jgi:hypothetical protein
MYHRDQNMRFTCGNIKYTGLSNSNLTAYLVNVENKSFGIHHTCTDVMGRSKCLCKLQ